MRWARCSWRRLSGQARGFPTTTKQWAYFQLLAGQKTTTSVVHQPIRRLREEKMGFKKLAEYTKILMLVIEPVKVKRGDNWVQYWESKMTKVVVPNTVITEGTNSEIE